MLSDAWVFDLSSKKEHNGPFNNKISSNSKFDIFQQHASLNQLDHRFVFGLYSEKKQKTFPLTSSSDCMRSWTLSHLGGGSVVEIKCLLRPPLCLFCVWGFCCLLLLILLRSIWVSGFMYSCPSCVIFLLFRESVCTIFVIGLINSLSRYFYLHACSILFMIFFSIIQMIWLIVKFVCVRLKLELEAFVVWHR